MISFKLWLENIQRIKCAHCHEEVPVANFCNQCGGKIDPQQQIQQTQKNFQQLIQKQTTQLGQQKDEIQKAADAREQKIRQQLQLQLQLQQTPEKPERNFQNHIDQINQQRKQQIQQQIDKIETQLKNLPQGDPQRPILTTTLDRLKQGLEL